MRGAQPPLGCQRHQCRFSSRVWRQRHQCISASRVGCQHHLCSLFSCCRCPCHQCFFLFGSPRSDLAQQQLRSCSLRPFATSSSRRYREVWNCEAVVLVVELRVWAGCDAVRDAHVQGTFFFRVGRGATPKNAHLMVRNVRVRVFRPALSLSAHHAQTRISSWPV